DDAPTNDAPELQRGAYATLAGVAMFIITVVALHLLQADYDPINQLMSELALGRYGDAMILAFAGLAIAMIGIQYAIGKAGAPARYRILLIVASAFFLSAGLFPLGETSELHIGAIAAAFVLSGLAMYLYPSSAGRASAAAPQAVSWLLAAGM